MFLLINIHINIKLFEWLLYIWQLQLLQQQATNKPTNPHAFQNEIYDYTSNNSIENDETFIKGMPLLEVNNTKDNDSNLEEEYKITGSNGLKNVEGVKLINETSLVDVQESISNEGLWPLCDSSVFHTIYWIHSNFR